MRKVLENRHYWNNNPLGDSDCYVYTLHRLIEIGILEFERELVNLARLESGDLRSAGRILQFLSHEISRSAIIHAGKYELRNSCREGVINKCLGVVRRCGRGQFDLLHS